MQKEIILSSPNSKRVKSFFLSRRSAKSYQPKKYTIDKIMERKRTEFNGYDNDENDENFNKLKQTLFRHYEDAQKRTPSKLFLFKQKKSYKKVKKEIHSRTEKAPEKDKFESFREDLKRKTFLRLPNKKKLMSFQKEASLEIRSRTERLNHLVEYTIPKYRYNMYYVLSKQHPTRPTVKVSSLLLARKKRAANISK